LDDGGDGSTYVEGPSGTDGKKGGRAGGREGGREGGEGKGREGGMQRDREGGRAGGREGYLDKWSRDNLRLQIFPVSAGTFQPFLKEEGREKGREKGREGGREERDS
jgi:hypothetical protein